MHPFTITPDVSARLAARCVTHHPFARLVGPRTALPGFHLFFGDVLDVAASAKDFAA